MNGRNLPRVSAAALCFVALAVSGCNGCQRPPPPVFDAGAIALVDAAPVEVIPTDLDAGVDAADAADAGKPALGFTADVNQRRAKQCCDALGAQAKALGNSPEAFQLNGIVRTCHTIASGLGPTKGPQIPELQPVRDFFKTTKAKIPAFCAGI